MLPKRAWVQLIGALLALLAGGSSGWITFSSLWLELVTRGALLSTGAWLFVRVVGDRARATQTTRSEQAYKDAVTGHSEQALTEDELAVAREQLLDAVQKRSMALKADSLILAELAQLLVSRRLRCVEEIEFRERHLKRTVDLDFALGSPIEEGSRLIPVTFPRKGGILENLEIKSASGKKLVVLNHLDTLAILHQVLLAWYAEEFTAGRNPEFALLQQCLSLIILPSGLSDPSIAAPAKPDDPNSPSAPMIAITRKLEENYPIIVVVPASEFTMALGKSYLHITYSYTRPLPPLLTAPASESRLEKLRRQWPECRNTFEIGTKRALGSESYYLRVLAPSNLIVGEGLFRDGEQVITRAVVNHPSSPDSHYEAYPPGDQPFAHVYTRNLSPGNLKRPNYQVRFYEKLPGTIGRAALSALTLFWITWLIGIGLQDDPFRSLPMASLALASQGALLTWLGVGGKPLLFGRSLAARISFGASIILSLVVTLVFFTRVSKVLPVRPNPIGEFLFVGDLAWSILLIVSLANLAFIVSTLAIRRRRSEVALGIRIDKT